VPFGSKILDETYNKFADKQVTKERTAIISLWQHNWMKLSQKEMEGPIWMTVDGTGFISLNQTSSRSEISGSHGGDCEVQSLLGCTAV
jgi:hypothetical protein